MSTHEKSVSAQTPLLSRVHFHPHCVHRDCTHKHRAVPSTTQNCWQRGAAGPDPNSSWFTFPELPSQLPAPKREAQTSWVGLWSGEPSEPLLALFAPTHIHTEAAGADPTQPVMVMLGFSHPGQQREIPLTAWLGLFGHHFGHSPGIACSSCVP